MDDLIWTVALLGGALSFLLYLYCNTSLSTKPARTPPGPTPWPIIGNLHQLGSLPRHTLVKLGQRYGPIFLLRFGSKPTIVISSPALAKEVLFTSEAMFADRPDMESARRLLYPGGLLFARYGEGWRKARKLCMVKLLASERLRETRPIRMEEVSAMLQEIGRRSDGGRTPLHLGSCVSSCITRMVCRLLIGKTDDVELRMGGSMPMAQLLHSMSALFSTPVVGDFIPCLGFLDFRSTRRMDDIHKLLDDFLSKTIEEHAARLSHGAAAMDFLDVLLLRKDDGELEHSDVKAIVMDLMGAGIETTSDTMDWILAELMHNPNVLQRLREEVDCAAGRNAPDGLIEEVDVAKLSYMHAVIKETFRLHPVVPLLIRQVSSDEGCQLGGYDIPRKARVIVNAWAMGRSRDVWGQRCEEFMPERFMEQQGRGGMELGGQHFELIPFGGGRRMCVGMGLAVDMISLTLANIVHSFHLMLPEGQSHQDLDMAELPTFTNIRSQPLVVVARPRAGKHHHPDP